MLLLTSANRLLRLLMVLTIAVMAVLVFINVVLRYGFNSNIGITEELARLLFVWLTFLGAISAFAKNTHVGVDTFLRRMPGPMRRVVSIASDIAMLVCCVMILIGSWHLTVLNMTNFLPISEIPVGAMYFAGIPASFAIGAMLVVRLWRKIARHGQETQK
jgi:TRAP-type C4-dicarboxylate transport system permease small subunit